jgi:hypothetical protein
LLIIGWALAHIKKERMIYLIVSADHDRTSGNDYVEWRRTP